MNEKPLITVITVVYNLIKAKREEFFIQCLESVHNQSYEKIEHIIVDGASDDGTIDLLKKYADKGWIKYISEPDTSIYDAMNKGANLAQGKYITFLNSDDFYNNMEGLEKCVKKLEKTNTDFSYARAKIVDESGNNPFKQHLYENPNIAMVFVSMPFLHQTMIVKTEVFKKLKMYDLTYKSASDYDFVFKMMFNGCSYTFCNFIIATFRTGGFSIINNELSLNEVAMIYKKYYSPYSPITIEYAKNIYTNRFLSFTLIKNLLPYFNLKNKIKFICHQIKIRFKYMRRFIFQFRFNKNEKTLRLLGIKIF